MVAYFSFNIVKLKRVVILNLIALFIQKAKEGADKKSDFTF